MPILCPNIFTLNKATIIENYSVAEEGDYFVFDNSVSIYKKSLEKGKEFLIEAGASSSKICIQGIDLTLVDLHALGI